jgi:hypothetical protein
MSQWKFPYLILLVLLDHGRILGQTAQIEKTDWSHFRGPSGTGIAFANNVPVKWSQESGLAWKVPLPGAGASSPVVFRDRVYLTAYTGYFVPGEDGG